MDISPQELKQVLDDNNPEFIVVDVREDWEFEVEHIAHVNISLYAIPERLDEFKKWEDKKVVVHCKTGKRSHQAQKFLEQQGFTNIINLTGGIENYQQTIKN